MPDQLYSITVVLTERQLRHLKNACMSYSFDRYKARMEQLERGYADTQRWKSEEDADEVERRVFRACESKFPMGKEVADAVPPM
jgi:hypothetical protein